MVRGPAAEVRSRSGLTTIRVCNGTAEDCMPVSVRVLIPATQPIVFVRSKQTAGCIPWVSRSPMLFPHRLKNK